LAGTRRAHSSGPTGTAKDRALRLLGVRWRSREELRRRLRQAGFEAEEIDAALEDLTRTGLVDDDRFAVEVVRDQTSRRGSGDRAIRAALAAKGVAPEAVAAAMASLGDEPGRALELARTRATRLRSLPPEAAFRRLQGLLQRRGYTAGVSREAARAALDELGQETPLEVD
jgi:regulatory protein